MNRRRCAARCAWVSVWIDMLCLGLRGLAKYFPARRFAGLIQPERTAERVDQKRHAGAEFGATRTAMHPRATCCEKRYGSFEVLNFPVRRCASDATRAFVIGRMKPDDYARPTHKGKQRILKLDVGAKDFGVPARRSRNIWNEEDQRLNVLQHVT